MMDVPKSILEHSKDRLRQPFLGAFTFSFATFNWDIFYYLYASDNNVETKVEYVKSTYNIYSDLVCPVLMALLVVFVPVFVNWLRQLTQEVLSYMVEKVRLHYSELDLEVAENNAKKDYARKRVEKEHDHDIEAIRMKRDYLEKEKADLSKRVEELEVLIQSQKEDNNERMNEIKESQRLAEKFRAERDLCLEKLNSMAGFSDKELEENSSFFKGLTGMNPNELNKGNLLYKKTNRN
jgi:hypothetical protein